MTRSRNELIPPDSPGRYHCVQRCVRRAFLCGSDSYTGQSYEHRKEWVKVLLHQLCECFAIAVHAYAVMSNHLHVVLETDPEAPQAWSDEEIAMRWVRLFPPGNDPAGEAAALKRQQLSQNPERLAVIRGRLSSVSWFMRCLAEPIARRANREDGCKGRFWEGRFKCQLLCDEQALLAAMAYVDLNPVRAGIAQELATSVNTSVYERIEITRSGPETLTQALRPLLGLPKPGLALTTADYLRILDWTGRALVPNKRGVIKADAPEVLARIDRDALRWACRVRGFSSGWSRVVGSAQDLLAVAGRIGQRWLRGVRLAMQLG